MKTKLKYLAPLFIIASFLFVFTACKKDNVTPTEEEKDLYLGYWNAIGLEYTLYNDSDVVIDHMDTTISPTAIVMHVKDNDILMLYSAENPTNPEPIAYERIDYNKLKLRFPNSNPSYHQDGTFTAQSENKGELVVIGREDGNPHYSKIVYIFVK